MSDKIEFSRNYTDLSTEQGFQFEFHCNRCGNGIRTQFEQSMTSAVSGVLDVAGDLLGGIFGKAADLGGKVKSAAYERGHDSAFTKAAKETRDEFSQCPRCSTWVCKKNCWNGKRNLCKECAPILSTEMSAAQATKSKEEAWAHACMADEDRKLERKSWSDVAQSACPDCKAELKPGAKFCAECGAKIVKEAACPSCGKKLPARAKFCPAGGTKADA